ncbi:MULTISPECIES: restriction endonuclease subunit S [Vibrio]|uniref:restriction endonuclease subunit S n=1 Tax=Vibrio TaxID=662 RepID=UPI00084B0C1C|nr:MULTISPECIES: restriction endonuclease subunit S [Vibrio]ODZ59872.1 hypothetical protein BBM44_17795 [Vibrio parahaemolyticus]
MSRLSICQLGDLIEFQRGYDLPKSKFVAGPYPVQSSNGILGYHNEYKVEAPGITIGRSGTVGLPHMLEENFYPHNTALYIKDFKGNDVRYIYYLLKYLKLGDKKSGSGVPTMNRNHLHPLTINAFRNITDQKSISSVLHLVDQKIELNNRINAELEAMAKTLYDYWFVQFDFPDANGKPYKASGGKMVYNDTLMREIPDGWHDGCASEIISFNPTTYLSKGSMAKYIDMDSLPVKGFMTKRPRAKEFAGGTKFVKNDVAVARITPCLENGKTALLSRLEEGEVGFGSTEFIILRGKNFPLFGFASCLSRSESFRQFAIANMTGTSGRKRIDAKVLETYSLAIPPKDLLVKYEETVSSFFKNMTVNSIENDELSDLRDWLLPMLMNGQVTVKPSTESQEAQHG